MTATLWADGKALGVLVVALLAPALLLGACGGGGDDGKGSNQRASTEQPDNKANGNAGSDGGSAETDAPTATRAGGGFNVCDLVSQSEIKDVTGFSVETGQADDFDPFFSCQWDSQEFDGLTVNVYHDDAAAVKAYYELTPNAEAVDGLGDRAQWLDIVDELEVLDGGYDVTVLISNFSDDSADTQAQAKELVQKILGRLP